MLDADELGWVLEHAQRENRRAVIEQRQQQEARLSKIRAKELRQRQRYETGVPRAKRVVGSGTNLKVPLYLQKLRR